MAKCSKSKPGSPTEQVPTGDTCVQDNASKSPTMDQEMNEPFMLVLSVTHNKEMSASFPCITIEIGMFPVDRDNKAMHAFIVDKITDMMCDAMKMHFTVTSKIQDGISRLVKRNYKHDAARRNVSNFWYLSVRATAMLPSHSLLPVNNASVLIPLLVNSFGCVHLMNSPTISQISCVSHSRTSR